MPIVRILRTIWEYMMDTILFWNYLLNSILLINHEIESAYWQEWKLFKLPGEITGFLIIHFPILFLILYGLIGVYSHTITGLILSIIVSMGGIFAFIIHAYFLKKGKKGFNLVISRIILFLTLIISIFQMAVSIILLIK